MRTDDSSGSEQGSIKNSVNQQNIQIVDEQYGEQQREQYEQEEQIVKFEREQIVKFEDPEEYEQVYEQVRNYLL